MKIISVFLIILLLSHPAFAKKWNWVPRRTQNNIIETQTSSDSFSDSSEKKVSEEENTEEEINSLIFFSREEFNKADINNDGKISEDEFLLFQEQDFGKIAAKNFIEFDLNKDKKISLEEIYTHLKQNEDFSEDEQSVTKNFIDADIDGDDFLDENEFKHYQQTSLLSNNKAIFRLFDADGDGGITYEDVEQILKTFQNLTD